MKYNAEYIKAQIIKWLLQGNLSFDSSRDAIGLEVLFSVHQRNADILILSKYLHALEIKGDFDDFKKLKGQLKDYHKTFDKVSLVTTPKHLPKIYKIIKPYIGLIVFDHKTVKVVRSAKRQKRLNRNSLLMFLPRKELTNLLKRNKSKELSTGEIRMLIVSKLTVKKIRKAAYSFLRKRYDKLFRLFLKDMSKNIVWDELRGLCGKIDEIYF